MKSIRNIFRREHTISTHEYARSKKEYGTVSKIASIKKNRYFRRIAWKDECYDFSDLICNIIVESDFDPTCSEIYLLEKVSDHCPKSCGLCFGNTTDFSEGNGNENESTSQNSNGQILVDEESVRIFFNSTADPTTDFTKHQDHTNLTKNITNYAIDSSEPDEELGGHTSNFTENFPNLTFDSPEPDEELNPLSISTNAPSILNIQSEKGLSTFTTLNDYTSASKRLRKPQLGLERKAMNSWFLPGAVLVVLVSFYVTYNFFSKNDMNDKTSITFKNKGKNECTKNDAERDEKSIKDKNVAFDALLNDSLAKVEASYKTRHKFEEEKPREEKERHIFSCGFIEEIGYEEKRTSPAIKARARSFYNESKENKTKFKRFHSDFDEILNKKVPEAEESFGHKPKNLVSVFEDNLV